jgi:hypothetical protein
MRQSAPAEEVAEFCVDLRIKEAHYLIMALCGDVCYLGSFRLVAFLQLKRAQPDNRA